MAITDIRLQNFRSYKDAAFELDKGVNIVVGPNGSGKTNLLEAILVLAIGKSYRAKAENLVLLGKPWTRLEAHTKNGSRIVKIDNQTDAPKLYEIDEKTFKRLPNNQKLPTVLFEPHHLMILTGRPELRRDYLDDLLEQVDPTFGKTRRDYKRVLAQRNALLKQGSGQTKPQLFVWNLRLSELGGTIVNARRRLIDDLNKNFAKVYKTLSNSKDKVALSYATPLSESNYVSNLLHKLEKNINTDYQRGFTTVGPHREDLVVSINGHSVQDVASRGETRTLVLALKILEISILEKVSGHKPLILLDDVFSELDGSRRSALTKYLKNHQAFITTTDADIIQHHFTSHSNIIALG